MLVPQEALTTLTCSECNNYLSIFPIYSSKVDQSFTCGRCINEVEDVNQHREFLYEALAQHMSFPCQYETYGCFKKFPPEKLAEHEHACTSKPFYCPCLPENSCVWEGQPSDLYEHYKDAHRILTFEHFKQEIDLINSYVENYVFLHNKETFIAKFNCNPKQSRFTCRIEYCGLKSRAEKYSYIIAFFNSKNDAYELPKRSVDITNIENVNTDNMTIVDINLLKSNLFDPIYILCRIKIEENNVEVIATKIKSEVLQHDETMLKTIECPVCLLYMVPPIMQCTTGHSICYSCKLQVSICPTCREPIGDTRNFSMEEFTKFINYPCKYRDYDCRYISTVTNIQKHESECEFVPVNCPITACDWKNKPSLMESHIRDCHDDKVLDVNTIAFICSIGNIEEETYLMIFNDQVFRLDFTYDGSDFYWLLQLMGPSKDHSRYMLELDISNNNELILVRKACWISEGGKMMDKEHPIIHLSGIMLKDVIHDDILTYNVRIILDNN